MKYTQILLFILPILIYSCNKDSQGLEEEVSISGSIVTKTNGPNDDELLAGVTVKLLQDGEVIQSTDDASFRFENLEAGRNYTIVPEKQDDTLNGVSSFDISLFEEYLNGSSPLDILQLVAADMDRDLIVNQDDLDILKECMQTPMMKYCLDWRFVHEDCESMDQEELINEIQFNALTSDKLDFTIYARNSGDLTG